MGFQPGENVGPYRITEILGQGGMASVCKAYHPALDRYVALKVLHPAFKEDPHFLTRFQREARVVARLEHPHIVPVYDFSEHNGQPYLVMKYIEGETLKARLDEGPLSKAEAIQITDAVGAALTYAHQRGVLHRDIKPSNILLSTDGSIFLADFGLARIAEMGASTLSKDMMLGTPQYISPEQAKGNQELDEGTDIYSLGVVMYEIVVGRVPFNADTPFSIIHDHIYTPLPMPRTVNPHVPEAVELVLLKSLAKAREDRFDTVDHQSQAFKSAVTDDVTDFLPEAEITVLREGGGEASTADASQQAPSQVPAADTGSQPDIQPRKRRRWIWVVVGVVISAFCLLAFLAALGGEDEPSPAPVEERTVQPTLPPPSPKAPELEPVDGRPQTHIRRAETLLDANRKALALAEYAAAGDIYLEQGDLERAIQTYMAALEISDIPLDRNRRIADPLAQALFLGASDEQLWPLIEEILVNNPDSPFLPSVKARMRLYQGSPEEVREIAESRISENGDDPLAYAVLAEYYVQNGAIDEALPIFERVEEFKDVLPPWLVEHFRWLESQI
jgi:serine/threonine protein kinase